MNIGLIVISKKEELYLDEWILYYKNLGINHIYFLDNNEKNDLGQKVLVSNYGDFITYYDLKGFTYAQFNQDIQKLFYTKIYNEVRQHHDWILFLDVDEFFTIENYTLNDFFGQKCYEDTAEILFNWKCYNDNDLVFYDNRPVQERFTTPYNLYDCYTPGIIENEHCKCAINCKYELKYLHQIHWAPVNGKAKNALGQNCNLCGKQKNIIHTNAYIKHYAVKTLEEFINKRIICKRLHCGVKNNDPKYLIQRFFNVNKHTKEKDDLANFVLDKL